MPEPPLADFTQTLVGSSATSRSRLTSSSGSESIEGRFPPGTLLNGRYRIIALLGKGGMGEVYRATDLTLGQSVALKFLPALAASESHWLERFHSEVRIARQVSHPNVCRVYDIGEAEGLPYISMEFVDGEDLSTLIRRIGRLPSDKAAEISRKICAGLAAAHSKGIIHRDLKPHNIMLDRQGEVLICDFGLAAVASELQPADFRQGTPAYMAPEQLKGTDVTTASDIYSLGLVLYELFTGKRAYSATSINDLLQLQENQSLTSMAALANDIDPAVENTIRQCLDPNPALRPPSALAVAAALPGGDPLAAALAAGQTPSPELVAAARSAALSKRYSIPLLAFILVFLLVLPWVRTPIEATGYINLDLPRAALEVRAREYAAQFGYPARPADWYSEFSGRTTMVEWLEKKPKLDWRKTLAEESPILLLYRQSPALLLANPDGQIGWNTPSLDQTNSLRLQLDTNGRLRYFEAVPPVNPATPPASFDSSQLFRATGLNPESFTASAPFRTPKSVFDEIQAFTGPHPSLPAATIDLQYATYHGRLTSLYVRYPWSSPVSDDVKPLSAAEQFNNYFTFTALLVFLFFAVTLARRNWLANRADRRGALRLFLFRVATGFGSWFLAAHFVPHAAMITFAGAWLAFTLLGSLILWGLYIALEPYLRQRWPQSIVTWNRLLAGRFLDTNVAAHALVGIGIGMVIVSTFMAKGWVAYTRLGHIAANYIVVDSPGAWLAALLELANNAIVTGFIPFFVLFGLRVALRRDIFVVLGGTLFLCAINSELWQSTNLPLDLAVYAFIALIVVVALLRFGMLTTLVAVFVANTIGRVPLTTDSSTWFMPYSFAYLLLIAALAVAALWRSLGDQPLLAEKPLP
jgi:serine/threonine-protein kinase